MSRLDRICEGCRKPVNPHDCNLTPNQIWHHQCIAPQMFNCPKCPAYWLGPRHGGSTPKLELCANCAKFAKAGN
jgi:hypothetical protein